MSFIYAISGHLLSTLQSLGFGFTTLVSITLALVAVIIARRMREVKVEGILPPVVPSRIPFFGHMKSIATDPHGFLFDCYEKYGPVFSVRLLGRTVTYMVGNEATNAFFSAKNEELNSQVIWHKVTTPLFGKDILFDVPHDVFLEQKKIMKVGQKLEDYVPVLQKEAEQYFEKLGDSGTMDIVDTLRDLIVYCISHCLNGPEIRSLFNEDLMNVMTELERGLSVNVLMVPPWFPLPCIRARDKAHVEIIKRFKAGVAKRRKNPNPPNDMLQNMIDAEFRSGTKLSDAQVSGLCLAIQVGGRHTTAVAISWLLFFLAKNKHHQDALYEEQNRICIDEKALNRDHINAMIKLDCCFNESLRLKPPIRTFLRMTLEPKNVCGYTVPPGHWVCIDPFVNQQLPEIWPEEVTFKPERFLDPKMKTANRFAFIPFSGGIHRCIGESFAYVMIKTIMCHLIRKYEFDLVDGYFPTTDFSSVVDVPANASIKYTLRKSV